MSKRIFIALMIVFCTLIASCSSNADNITIEMTEIQNKIPTYQMSLAFNGESMTSRFDNMAEVINRRSDGDIYIEVYPGDMLGSDPELVEALALGSISLVAGSSAIFEKVVPESIIMSAPATKTDIAKQNVAYEAEFFELLNTYFQAKGLELLSAELGEYRMLSTTEKVTTIEEIQNLMIRTLPDSSYIKYWDLVGATTLTGISFRNLYSALDDGVVNAQENSPTVYLSANLEQVTPYVLNGPFYVAGNFLVMNKQSFDLLPKDYQEIIKEEAMRSSKIAVTTTDVSTGFPSDVTYTELSDTEKTKLEQLVEPLWEEIMTIVDPKLIETMVLENQNYDDE